MAQPSISRYMGQLEEEWGVNLFDRRNNRMMLTPEGEDYYHLCARLTKDLADLKRKHTEDPLESRYSVTYSVFPAWNVTPLMYNNAAYVREKHPSWDVNLKICRAESLVKSVRSGEVDVIFYVNSLLAQYKDLVRQPLLELPQVIIYSSNDPLASKPNLQPSDFAEREFLYVPDAVFTPEVMQRQVRSLKRKYGFAFRPRIVENIDALTMSLEAGHGVALMDYWSRYRANPNLKYLSLDVPLPVVMAWRKDCPNPAVPLFVEDTLEYFHKNLY